MSHPRWHGIASPSLTLLGPDYSDRITGGWCQAAKTLSSDANDLSEMCSVTPDMAGIAVPLRRAGAGLMFFGRGSQYEVDTLKPVMVVM